MGGRRGRGSWGARKLGAAEDLETFCLSSVCPATVCPMVSGVHLWDSPNHLFHTVENRLEEGKIGGGATSLGASSVAHAQYGGSFYWRGNSG